MSKEASFPLTFEDRLWPSPAAWPELHTDPLLRDETRAGVERAWTLEFIRACRRAI